MVPGHLEDFVKAADHNLSQLAIDVFLAPEKLLDILHPFEIGDRYAASIRQNIGDYKDPIALQDFVGLGGGGPICSLDNNPGPDLGRILQGNDISQGRWNQDIACHSDQIFVGDAVPLPLVADRGPLRFGLENLLWVKTLGVIETTFGIADGDDFRSQFMKDLGRAVSYVAKPLNGDSCFRQIHLEYFGGLDRSENAATPRGFLSAQSSP